MFTLSDDWRRDVEERRPGCGTNNLVPLGPNAAGLHGAYNQGPIPTIAGGPWTHMRADVNFTLSGDGDRFTFNGAKVLVPEPGTLLSAVVVRSRLRLSPRGSL